MQEEGSSSPARNLEAGKDSTNVTLTQLAPGTCYLVGIWAVAGPYRSLPKNITGCTGEHPYHPQGTWVGALPGGPGINVGTQGEEGPLPWLLPMLTCCHLLPLAASMYHESTELLLVAWGKQDSSLEMAVCSEPDLFLSDSCVCLSSQFLLHQQT